MTNLFKKILYISIFVVLFVGMGAYAYSRLRHLASGPMLEEINIEDMSVTENPHLVIEGLTKNTSKINLSGMSVLATQDGKFREDIVLVPGYNIIELSLEDRFGKIKKHTFSILLNKEDYQISAETISEESNI